MERVIQQLRRALKEGQTQVLVDAAQLLSILESLSEFIRKYKGE